MYEGSISIHALTRSATLDAYETSDYLIDFNPRTHEECDWPDLL